MFEQPPLTDREVFGRGFVLGLAAVFLSLLLSLIPTFRFGPAARTGIRTDLVYVWPILSTLCCAGILFTKDEERIGLFRAGVLASNGLFLFLLLGTVWTFKL